MKVLIPTIKRYDLLSKCVDSLLAQTKPPESIVIIDNGGFFEHAGCQVLKPSTNWAVSRCWNYAWDLWHSDTLISNDDIEFGPEALETVEAMDDPFISLVPGCFNWSCFLQRKEVWEKCGRYDDTFLHYFGDSSFRIEMARQNIPIVDVPGIVHHGFSATSHQMNIWEQRKYEWERLQLMGYFTKKHMTCTMAEDQAHPTDFPHDDWTESAPGFYELFVYPNSKRRIELLPNHCVGQGLHDETLTWHCLDGVMRFFADHHHTYRLEMDGGIWRSQNVRLEKIA